MTTRIGIPSSLFYYVYFPMWHTFFNELGVEVVTSGQTNKDLLDKGVKEALTDACVPVKLYFGHAITIKNKVDYLFIPRIVCTNGKNIYCPKFLGLPDMIRHGLTDMPPIIDIEMDSRKGWFSLWKAYYKVGSIFCKNKVKIFKAYMKSKVTNRKYNNLLLEGLHPNEAIDATLKKKPAYYHQAIDNNPGLVFAVIGYPYIVHDDFISAGLINKLKTMGVTVITMENLLPNKVSKSSQIDKKMFWTFSDMALNSAYFLFKEGRVDGIIHVTAFGCGPDSMVDMLMEIASREYPDIPYMSITIDEHTGDAGTTTRLEAFYDMVTRKKEAIK